MRSIEACPAWEEPLSTTQNTLRAEGVGLGRHDRGDQLGEGCDPGCGGDGADHAGVVDVVGGKVGQGSAPAVLELDLAGMARAGGPPGVAAAQRLELGLLVGTDHVVVRAQRSTAPGAGVEVQDPALVSKSGSRGKIQERCCQGLITDR